jgi:predicted transcriptional regulator
MLKKEIKKVIEEMPSDCTLEGIQYTLYVRSKIEEGLSDIKRGNLISQEEVEKGFAEWLDF